MNLSRSQARRAEIVAEQSDIAGKHRRSAEDNKRFDELQHEFDKVHAEILRHEAEHGPDPGPIRPMPAGSAMGGYDIDRQPGADQRAWSRQVAATIMEKRGLDVSGSGVATPPFFDANLRTLPWGALSVRALIPSVKVDGGTVHAVRQKDGATGRDNNAAAVAHGAAKPETIIGIERVDVTIRTIAHVSEPIEVQLLDDFNGLAAFVGTELRSGVLQKTEDLLINGNNTPPQWQGLLSATTQSITVGTLSAIDTIYSAMNTVRASFFEPDAVVLSADDAEDIRLSKDGMDQYNFGPPALSGAETIFGKPLIVSPLMPAGVGLVGAFAQGATIYDRSTPRIDWATAGYVDSATDYDLFVHNMVRARAEERLGFVVNRPAAFCEIDFIP